MAEARTFSCPSCGGPASDIQRSCDFCRAPIATVRCARCFHMNVPDAVHCSGCGWQLGLEPFGEADELGCPHCESGLRAFRGTEGLLRDCGECGGQFVDHTLLRDLIERREVRGTQLPQHTPRKNSLSEPVRYVPCPACKQLMNRRNFGQTSGIIVDTCRAHGVWFDAGELPRVLAFVETGGLARARRRELEELERSRRQAGLARARPPVSSAPYRFGAGHSFIATERRALLVDDVADCVNLLLEGLGSLIRGK